MQTYRDIEGEYDQSTYAATGRKEYLAEDSQRVLQSQQVTWTDHVGGDWHEARICLHGRWPVWFSVISVRNPEWAAPGWRTRVGPQGSQLDLIDRRCLRSNASALQCLEDWIKHYAACSAAIRRPHPCPGHQGSPRTPENTQKLMGLPLIIEALAEVGIYVERYTDYAIREGHQIPFGRPVPALVTLPIPAEVQS